MHEEEIEVKLQKLPEDKEGGFKLYGVPTEEI